MFSIPDRIQQIALSSPRQIALIGVDGKILTYAELQDRISKLAFRLRQEGLQRSDRVSVVVTNGPDGVIALLATCSVCAAVPLNPASRSDELEGLLVKLGIRACVTETGLESQVLEFSRQRSIRIIENCNASQIGSVADEFSKMDDVALLMTTSGTTDTPKAVPLTHRNVVVSATDLGFTLQLSDSDRCLNLMPLFHRSGISVTISSLIAGASVILPPAFSAPHFWEWVERFSPTWYSGSPVMHRSILARAAANQEALHRHRFRFIRSSASFLSTSLMQEIETTFSVPVIETYSTTETGLIAATPFQNRKTGSVGVRVSGEVRIMNEAGEVLPAGVTGEIVVRGPNVFPGYINDPEDHQESLLNGWFRTGDLGYLDSDQHLFLQGRKKEIINRGGQKVSPGEVEKVLLRHPAVQDAAAFPVQDPDLQETVGCAVVLHPGSSATQMEIQQFASKYLTEYKVPAAVVFCSTLPLDPAGKLNRKALSKLHLQTDSPPMDPGQLRETEEKILDVWKSILEISTVGTNDRFFHVGGDSLLATQLVNRLQDIFEIDLSIKTVFESSTIREQAVYIQKAKRTKRRTIERIDEATHYPVSFNQQRLWFLYQLAPESPVYNIAKQVNIHGPLDSDALIKALKAIVDRHESLRTKFISLDGVPHQKVDSSTTLEIPFLDLSDQPADSQEDEIAKLAQQEAQRPFHLERDLMLRAKLIRKSASEHVLLLINHHIVSDRWATGLFFDELSQHYLGLTGVQSPQLEELPIQYRDFAFYQRKTAEETLSFDYWKKKLTGAPVLSIHANWAARDLANFKGTKQSLLLSGSLVQRVHEFCRNENVTTFMFYMAVLQTLLHRYSGQNDILVGTPISGRFCVEIEKLLGFFANTLIIRGDLSGDPSFRQFLHRIKQISIEAFTHQDIPFERIVEVTNPLRSGGHFPLFDVVLTVVATPRKLHFGEIDLDVQEIYTGTSKFPLHLSLAETPDGILATFTLNTCLFEDARIQQMLTHFSHLLEEALDHPDQTLSKMSMLSAEERERLLVEWSPSSSKCFTHTTIADSFQEIARQFPDRTAVKCESRSLTYEELNQRANTLACYLRDAGVKTETLVGISIQRSVETIVGLLGILKAGGAYVPIDPDYPEERRNYLLKDANIKLLLTEQNWPQIERISQQPPENHSGPDSLCYVIYTSGSTGQPKSVGALNQGVLRIAKGLDFLQLSPEDRFLQHSTLSFDASSFEIWGALLNGACLVIPEKGHLSLQELGTEIVKNKITTLWLTAPLFSQMIDHQLSDLKGVRNLLAGGDVLSASHVQRAKQYLSETKIINGYGPTECTTFTCCYIVPDVIGNSIPIGRPVANTSVYILDSNLQPVPVGVTGQLYVSGDGLARGYINDDNLTGSKFAANPFQNGRMYATGDLVHWLSDGNIAFEGRSDDQVKIRGFRVETGEVESAIKDFPSVRDCVVIVREDQIQNRNLFAYVLAGAEFKPENLLTYLRSKIPSYMIPSRIISVASFPLNSSGKVDKKSLPEPSELREKQIAFVPPADDLEKQLVEIWQRLLKIKPVGITDDFFDLGGHSLLAVQLFAEIRKITGKELPLATLFDTPTIRGLSRLLRETLAVNGESLVAIQPVGIRPPFFCVHGLGGNVLNYKRLANHLGDDQPIYGLQSKGLHGKSEPLWKIEDMAACYLEEIRKVQPQGPYYIGGASLGGVIAFEMAQQLLRQNQEIGFLALLDSSAMRWTVPQPQTGFLPQRINSFRSFLGKIRSLLSPQRGKHFHQIKKQYKMRISLRMIKLVLGLSRRSGIDFWKRIRRVRAINSLAFKNYIPRHLDAAITLFQTTEKPPRDATNGWAQLCREIEIHKIPGNHHTMLHEPNVKVVGKKLGECLDKAWKAH